MTKNEIDKKLFILDYETKEQLLELLDTAQKLANQDVLTELDFECLDILKDEAYKDWMQINIDAPEYRESMHNIKTNLHYLAAHCLRIINKLE